MKNYIIISRNSIGLATQYVSDDPGHTLVIFRNLERAERHLKIRMEEDPEVYKDYRIAELVDVL